jgi:dihydrofolate synthase/folylpolyglutamate synthase
MDAEVLKQSAERFGLVGEIVKDVSHAIDKAKSQAGSEDFIFIGGSTFVVAEIENL